LIARDPSKFKGVSKGCGSLPYIKIIISYVAVIDLFSQKNKKKNKKKKERKKKKNKKEFVFLSFVFSFEE